MRVLLLLATLSLTEGLRITLVRVAKGERSGASQMALKHNLSRRAALAILPVAAAPHSAQAYVQDTGGISKSSAQRMADSAGARGAEVRIAGTYVDKSKPGRTIKVLTSGRFLRCKGTDADGSISQPCPCMPGWRPLHN